MHARHARSFGAVAEAYDRVCPGYPGEALVWLLPEGTRRVVDLGAGTGALTRSLVARGLGVVAVEPDPQMRAVLSARLGAADVRGARAGTSRSATARPTQWWVGRCGIGSTSNLPPRRLRACSTAATCSVCFGTCATSESRGWRSCAPSSAARTSTADPLASCFPRMPLSSRPLRPISLFAQQLVPEDLVDLVASRSHVQVLRDDERAALLERVARFARVHPELAGRATIEVPYVTFCWRATRA